MEQKEVLLIIPAYNEEKNIGKVMDQLAQPEIAGAGRCTGYERCVLR